MDVNNSNLTDLKYGYDFVVSTTQASINSGLLEYLWESNQPVDYICYISDSNNGNATTQISLDELLKRTDGVNPFEILDGASPNDPRIEELTRNNFVVGVKIRIGVPPGVMPKELPPILELGKSDGKSLFRMFCSEFQVIQNTKSEGPSANGRWNVWNQPSGSPWYIETDVNILNKSLDWGLETPYFNHRPELMGNLKSQFNYLPPSKSYSLQQTLMDLETAADQSTPNFVGIPVGSPALEILQKNFVDLYSKAAKSYGQPILAVAAVAEDHPDPSTLQVTSVEVGISRYKDSNACVVNNPTPEQAAAATLDHLCMTNCHSAPTVSDPYWHWNWVQPGEVKSESGVIAIKRSVFAEQLMNIILPSARNSCLTSQVDIEFTDSWGNWKPVIHFSPGQWPQIRDVKDPSKGDWIIDITWSAEGYPGVKCEKSEMGVFCDSLQVVPHYYCEVKVNGSIITINQRLWVVISLMCERVTQPPLNAYDVTITDTYNLSVGQNGHLKIKNVKSQKQDDSQSPGSNYWGNIYAGITDHLKDIKAEVTQLASLDLESINFATPHNFVFPGGKVFTYTSARFSNHQDLICDITYAAPTKPFQPPPRVDAPVTDPSSDNLPTRPAPKLPEATGPPAYSMAHTTDLIQNYIQGEIVAPTAKFEALQTDDGHSLLFSLSTDNVFNVIMEQSRTTKTGWVRMPLSPLSSASTSVRTFDVGQSVTDGTIGMALVVSEGGSDKLLLSLCNSSSDTSWTAKPQWSTIDFDAEGDAGSESINIVRVMFAEPQGSRQHIIVDIDRSSNKADKDIARYYVNPHKTSGRSWTLHGLPVDIQKGYYQSCVGRVAYGFVDGVYTLGTAGDSAQLVYVPIENAFGDGPPLPCRLELPTKTQASAIAAARRSGSLASPDGTTDLFAVSNSTLFYFPAECQTDGSVATQLLESNVLSGTTELAAMTHRGVTTIWGKNASNDVYYLSCPSSQLNNQKAWSVPVPIVFGVEQMTPYLNRSDGGNAIFTSGSGKLERLTQATGTDAKLWAVDEIKLEATGTKTKPLQFKSYTTTIQVLDEHELPATGVNLSISTSSRTPVYMNGIYYVLGPAPVAVVTDATGSLTVVEALQDSINGTLMKVTCNNGEAKITINPMEKSFQTVAALSSEGALRDAKVPTNTVSGGIRGTPTWTTLVEETVSSNDMANVANSLSKLGTTYGLVKPTVTPRSCMSVIPHTLYTSSSSVDSLGHDVAIAAGDLFRWLKSDVDHVIDIIKDDATEAWHFVATISGKVYHAALTSVEAIVGAAEWIFNAIKTGIKKVMSFVEFLYDWDDIERTKKILCNMTRQWLSSQVASIQTTKSMFDVQMANAEEKVKNWAGIPDCSKMLGSKASQPTGASASNPAKGHTSGFQMMMTHYKNHGANLTIVGATPKMARDASHQAINDLLDALEKEGQTLSDAYAQLKSLAEGFSSMTVEAVLKELVGIVGVTMLSTVQVVVDALLTVLIDLADSAIGLLDTRIHIPVISDILNDIGISDVTYLDLVCWIPAMSYTVIYKIANQEAPFAAHEAEVQAFLAADNWEALQTCLGSKQSRSRAQSFDGQEKSHMGTAGAVSESSNTFMALQEQQPNSHQSETSVTSISSAASVTSISTAPTSPTSTRSNKPAGRTFGQEIYHLGHIIGSTTKLMAAYVDYCEVLLPAEDNPYSKVSTSLLVLDEGSAMIADLAVDNAPIEDVAIRGLSKLTTIIRVGALIVFNDLVQNQLPNTRFRSLVVASPADVVRTTGAMVDAVLAAPAAIISLDHLFEIARDVVADKEMDQERGAAVAGEVSNLASYVSRFCYYLAAQAPRPTGLPFAQYMAYADLAGAGLEVVQAEL
ncbi:uncharacterized protein CCOS01_04334 [Colletotrichum costaricense]|uniref:Uncharacterized protein n=1 Tax=Colletotrichum costaricense TaxID=1209916 RepID=A0AAI9Z2P4_9PEZI|nr:uncharacterized protein CCOS01_04334 [Colletotrichum costaricense]KAK1532351.1 hypothetical protein CCOS01_04334 [Colletotrichum costaricense]